MGMVDVYLFIEFFVYWDEGVICPRLFKRVFHDQGVKSHSRMVLLQLDSPKN